MPPLLSTSRKKRTRPSRGRTGRPSGRSWLWRWLLGVALVLVVAGIGMLKWAETRRGQAALLTLGSTKMYSEVQAAVEQALVTVLPELPRGPATRQDAAGCDLTGDCDRPAPELGPGAAIRCRKVAVGGEMTWWALQQQVAEALEQAGARVLWGRRLYPERPGPDQLTPNEKKDLLRLDVGVPGRPTHTLVLYRAGSHPTIRWDGGGALSGWETLASESGPVVALVIDDWGNNTSEPTARILGLDIPLTMSILPGRSFSRHFALMGTALVLPPTATAGGKAATAGDEARALRLAAGCPVEVSLGRKRKAIPVRRREIILHLPMEPQGYPDKDPGPGALMVGMGEQQISDLLDADLRGLPAVAGLNNHMGSAATSDEATMAILMKILKRRGLYFLDSLTTSRSVAYREARKAGVRALRNRTFLDYDLESPVSIRANLQVLVDSARKNGFAVGIGHPHPVTAQVLAEEIPRLKREGVRFVTLSELLALQDAAQEGGR